MVPADAAPTSPSRDTENALRRGLEVLRAFPGPLQGERPVPPSADPTSEVLKDAEETLRALRREIEALGPWFETFVGSSLVVTMATRSIDEALEPFSLHLHQLREPPSQVVSLVARPVHVASERLQAVIELLPGHVRLARRMSARERSFGERVQAMPRKLRRRFYVGLLLGVLFLLSVAVGAVILLVPSVGGSLGVSSLIAKYAPTSAGVIVMAVLFFTGARLILGSIWLTRTISILPQYEERRVDAAKAGIARRETQVLGKLAPKSESPDPLASPGTSGSSAPARVPPASELRERDA
ncbi:MAG: hypothetical protein KGJ23_12785 [Euryarchaeota archaeon]|nr:hypothetical protein [Euryarchaeota archaeon]MDE1837475.1 hypothetical protein [Euryarchaeota archaeon]MDE1881781.1 hypothetical protein [Euryarchaeota archaeon]MDE2045559.1 hypothetical protein [Thermoplasmata archaeon]